LRKAAVNFHSTLQDCVDAHGAVPLSWVGTTRDVPYPNLGDALSPIIVSALTGLPVQHRGFDQHDERLVAVGTIGHAQRNGIVNFWGTGIDDGNSGANASPYLRPPDTRFRVHAMRGPYSARALRREGEIVPDVYGDPVVFLPKMVASCAVEKRRELGVVLHISELEQRAAEAQVQESLLRYQIPPDLRSKICIINTYKARSAQALFDKIDEIRSCRRIASTSFHGLIIAETFAIPCVWYAKYPGGPMTADIDDTNVRIDHRVRDFYAGTGCREFSFYAGPPKRPTNWDDLISTIDKLWSPIVYDMRPLFESFPLRKSVSLDDPTWPLDWNVLDTIRL
jgi:hypothetical protein